MTRILGVLSAGLLAVSCGSPTGPAVELQLIPYDYVDVRRAFCERILRLFTHRAEASFAEEGVRRIVVLGWDPIVEDTVRLEHHVVVRSR